MAGTAAGALLLAGGLFLAVQVGAVSGDLSIGSATAAPGDSASVDLVSDVGDPGLGAWTVDISYDADVVSVSECSPEEGGVCNPEFDSDTVRITGASATGLEGETVLGTITFDCADEEGESDLTLAVEVFADATVGEPADIDETVTDGSITCAEEEPAPAATATRAPGIGDVGQGPTSGSSDMTWVIAALAGLGLAAMAGYGVLRVRTRDA
jgi:hypothetical protein